MKTACTKKRHSRKQSNFLKAVGIVCLLFISMTTLQAQDVATNETKDILVKGKVADEAGPLPGVNILLQGTSVGTSTDFEGNFEFPKRLKKGDVLIFSSIGFKSQKIVIDNKNSASNIKLNIDMILEEVVIIGKAASKKVFKSKRN